MAQPKPLAVYRCRAVVRADGSLTIIHPCLSARFPEESDDAFYSRVLITHMDNDPELRGRPFIDVLSTEIPADRTFRSRWKIVAGKLVAA